MLALGLVGCAAPSPRPQNPPREVSIVVPRLPIGVDLAKAPVGSWAEYEETFPNIGTPPPGATSGPLKIKTRIAYVASEPDGNTIEMAREGRGEAFVQALLFGPDDGGGRVRKNVIQRGAAEPMELPIAKAPNPWYTHLNPQSFVAVEEVTVRAGTFEVKHYRDRPSDGERIDYWMADAVWPLGLVKLDAEYNQPPRVHGVFSTELIATGRGARPQITRPAIPFDPAKMKKPLVLSHRTLHRTPHPG
jgi:hypothetical protein